MSVVSVIKHFLHGLKQSATAPVEKAMTGTVETEQGRDDLLLAAHAHFDFGRYREALTAYSELISTAPAGAKGLYKLHVNVGGCHELLGQLDEAVASYRTAIDLNAECAEANLNLSNLFRRLGKDDLAAVHQSRLAQLRLGPALHLREILNIPVIAPSAAAIDQWRTQFAARIKDLAAQPSEPILQPEIAVSATAIYLAYQGRNDVELSRQVCATIRRFYATPNAVGSKSLPAGRIRIGFVSSFFCNHSIGRLYRGIIGSLDRQRFEVFVFSINHQADETALLIGRHADVFFSMPEHVPTIVESIRGQNLDVLYYPEIGLHPVPYYLAYWRLAPVQCMSYGHPVTSGIDTIDYFLSASSIDSEANQAHYTEKLIRLDGFFMPAYERPAFPHEQFGVEAFGANKDQRVYFCSQTLFKFHPDFDFILHEILKRDASAVLVLIDAGSSSWKPALMERLNRVMPEVTSRIRFIPAQSTANYVNLLKAANVVLDTLHFGGGISVMDAFAAHVPIVTLEGQFFRGRQAAACYREMGMEDCIVHTPEEYVERALAIGSDPHFRAVLSKRIERANSRLYNRMEAIRSLEDFLATAVARQRSLHVDATPAD